MHDGDGGRSFADRRRDALAGSMARIPCREDARNAGLEQARRPRQRLTANPVRQKMVLRMVWERKTWIRLLRTGIEKINLQNEPTNFVQGSKAARSVSAD